MARNTVLVLVGHGANDALRGQMGEYAYALDESGASVMNFSLDQEGIEQAAQVAASGEVAFALTWLGAAQDISVRLQEDGETRNLWETFGIPLLKIQGDLPAYFADRHRDIPGTAVSLYAAPEFLHFRRRWLPDASAMAGIIPSLPLAPLEREEIDASIRREGALVFLKNGNAPGELLRLWQEQLPPRVAQRLRDLADEIAAPGLRSGALYIGDFVAQRLQDVGVEPVPYLVCFFSAQLDDYLRRLKSTMIAEALLDFPVIVQGSFWDHVDFTGRRARRVEGQGYAETASIYKDQLGIIDMSPNVDLSPHERVQRAAGSFTTFLTNRQSWLEKDFPACRDLLFDFDPDSIRQRVDDVLRHRDRYLELGLAFGEQFRKAHPREAFGSRVMELGQLALMQWQKPRPALQPFFIWPQTRQS